MTILTFALLISSFALALIARSMTGKKICAMCAAVTITWFIFLIARKFGYDIDIKVIGILMGGSAVGLVYFLSSKLSEQYEILKFPFLITLFWLIYRIITGIFPTVNEGFTLLAIWILFGLIFWFYANDRFRTLGKKIIECCKNW